MKIVEIVFSPTGGTEKVANVIAKHWGKDVTKVDLCDSNTDFSKCKIDKGDMALIAMPSFGGRVPAIAVERLKKIAGNGAGYTLVCVYGNRAYEDTLVEMEDIAKECRFQVIAAVAAVAQHSGLPQFAAGRPDSSDEEQLADFAKRIAGKARASANTVSIPGNRPYKKGGGVQLVPKPNKDCAKCGQCAEKCPVQAIAPDGYIADSKKCISCMRCLKQCPSRARKINGVLVSVASLVMKKACSGRKENELFL